LAHAGQQALLYPFHGRTAETVLQDRRQESSPDVVPLGDGPKFVRLHPVGRVVDHDRPKADGPTREDRNTVSFLHGRGHAFHILPFLRIDDRNIGVRSSKEAREVVGSNAIGIRHYFQGGIDGAGKLDVHIQFGPIHGGAKGRCLAVHVRRIENAILRQPEPAHTATDQGEKCPSAHAAQPGKGKPFSLRMAKPLSPMIGRVLFRKSILPLPDAFLAVAE
jgi:hypothetical protein